MLDLSKKDTLELDENVVIHGIPGLEKFWAFNLQTGDQYTLNETAHFILSHFGEATSIGKVLDHFMAEFDVPPKAGKKDVLEILTEYLNEGILIRR